MSYHPATMPFGKFRGRRLAENPGSYLFWLLEEATTLDRGLRSAIERELLDRLPERDPPPSLGFDPTWFSAWYRRAAMVCHPDHLGGNTRAMALLNELMELVTT